MSALTPGKKYLDGGALKPREGEPLDEMMARHNALAHKITLDEGQRQMVLKALAVLSLKSPGWNYALTEIALLMDNQRPDGKPQMFEDFKKYNTPP